jgi:polar amino acid transport system substrate-binding protein
VAVAGCASGSGGASSGTGPAATVEAYYTADQSARGQRTFSTICAVCHGRNEFTGPIFQVTWMADPVGAIYDHISTKMPQNRPGSLSAQEYVDVIAYMLQLNRRPAGERELPADPELLARMRW